MDAHYDLVMKARAEAGNEVRRYFAYSTALDLNAFNEWKNQHAYGFFSLPQGKVCEAVDLELVYDCPSRWWGGRVAGLQNAKGKSVFGVVFDISGKDWPIIQHKEGGVTGLAVEREVQLRISGSAEMIVATAFTTNPARASTEGPVSARFVEALVRGIENSGLPKTWVDSVRNSNA